MQTQEIAMWKATFTSDQLIEVIKRMWPYPPSRQFASIVWGPTTSMEINSCCERSGSNSNFTAATYFCTPVTTVVGSVNLQSATHCHHKYHIFTERFSSSVNKHLNNQKIAIKGLQFSEPGAIHLMFWWTLNPNNNNKMNGIVTNVSVDEGILYLQLSLYILGLKFPVT